jgi:ABC-type branched-subunit amino acid transport system substrate-binding protein
MGMIKIFIIACIFGLGGNYLFAQVKVPENPQSQQLLELGKKYLKTKNYVEAATTFQQIDEQKFNTVSTAAIYLSGIAWLEAGLPEKAMARFNRIINFYPASKYNTEAKYHKAYLLMHDTATREYGLKMMMDVGDGSKDKILVQQSKDVISHFLHYETDTAFLKYYVKVVRESYKNIVAEALCYQWIQNGKYQSVINTTDKLDSTGKRLSPRLKLMREKCISLPNKIPPRESVLKISVLMPFFATEEVDSLELISTRSLAAVEFLEGMELAMDNYKSDYPLKIILEPRDIKRDTQLTRKYLTLMRYDSLPHLIIGSYYNTESRMIAEWSEAKQVCNIIPYSPENYLIDKRKYVFLAGPSLKTHALKMEDYAVNLKLYKSIAVLFSEERITKTLADEFTRLAIEDKATIIPLKYSANMEKAQTQIPDLIASLKGKSVQAIYIPSSEEEAAGLILSHLRLNALQPVVLGSPEFRNFRAIEKELMDQFKIVFSDTWYEQNNSELTEQLIHQYANTYSQRLTPHVVRGYDLMNRIIEAAINDEFGPISMSDKLRKLPTYKGINQNFRFEGKQDNQALFILTKEGRTIGKEHEY